MKHTVGLSHDKLREAQNKIAEQILHQCEHGQQNQRLPLDVRSCGQFFGGQALVRQQRGVHGTAAALSVLLQHGTEPALATADRLVKYLAERQRLEQNALENAPEGNYLALDRRLKDDDENVIKQAELLAALASKSSPSAVVVGLLETVRTKLIAGEIDGKYWCSFIGETEGLPEIATGYAVWSLSVADAGSRIGKAVEYVKEQYSTLSKSSEGDTTIGLSKKVLLLYCLVFRLRDFGRLDKAEREELSEAVKVEWKLAAKEMKWDSEQTIEYFRGSENYYMRIPWQLYLLSLKAVVDPQSIYSDPFQEKLARMVKSVEESGFCYGGGTELSTRTNAVVYDCLDQIRRKMESVKPSIPRLYWDRTRVTLGSKTASVFYLLGCIFIGCYLAWRNLGKPDTLGPFFHTFFGAIYGLIFGALASRAWKVFR